MCINSIRSDSISDQAGRGPAPVLLVRTRGGVRQARCSSSNYSLCQRLIARAANWLLLECSIKDFD